MKNNVIYLVIAFLTSLQICCASGTEDIVYYCPRDNISLILAMPKSEKEIIRGVATSEADSSVAPQADIIRSAAPVITSRIDMGDCSNWKFLCKEVTQKFDDNNSLKYLLVIPRNIGYGKEYDYRGVHIVTRRPQINFTNKNRDFGDRDSFGTVTLWQSIAGHQVPMELTIASSRGLVFLDGIKNFPEEESSQMCVLQTAYGIFLDAKVIENSHRH